MRVPPDAVLDNEHRPEELDRHRRELTGYCYRMLGSAFEAEDAVQETMLRAWRAADRFEGRSTLRSWLFRIATNVCLDMLRGRGRRAMAMDLGPAGAADSYGGTTLAEQAWISPVPDATVAPGGDPAEVAEWRDTVRLAFVTALQQLPPRQRAVLILREVLGWQAAEVARLLDTTVASVNSALQRARATLASRRRELTWDPPVGADARNLLARYVDAFERYDVETLVSLLHEEAVMSMPPYDFWLQGPVEIGRWFLGEGIGCRGSRLVPTAANGSAAFGSYRRHPEGGHRPWALQVVEVEEGRIVGHHNFLDRRLSEVFGLPAHIP